MSATKIDNVLKEGWIFKQSKHWKTWRKRFMQLKGDELFCYQTDQFINTDEKPTETFNLSLHKMRVDRDQTEKQIFYLIDETSKTSRTFKALSENDRNDWIDEIRNSIISPPNLETKENIQFDNIDNGVKINGNKNIKTASIQHDDDEKTQISSKEEQPEDISNLEDHSITIHQIDSELAAYYKKLGVDDYYSMNADQNEQIGKLKLWYKLYSIYIKRRIHFFFLLNYKV